MAAMSSPRLIVCLPETGPKIVPIARMVLIEQREAPSNLPQPRAPSELSSRRRNSNKAPLGKRNGPGHPQNFSPLGVLGTIEISSGSNRILLRL
eukprot:1804935-Pyramimonas_sp.AAC.1